MSGSSTNDSATPLDFLGPINDSGTMEKEEPVMIALEHFQANMDVFFLIIMGTIIFFMQCGFAFLEAGAVRSKNTTNILIKNMLDVLISGISYWLVGYALAFGEGNGFCGTEFWASKDVEDDKLAFWFFQFVFAATATTIVSGSMAERCAFNAYFIYSVLLTGFIYPIISHWAWAGDGWLANTSYQDFAGSGVVHLTGGIAALVGAVILGPRIGRFGPNSKDIRGHSIPLAALGGFILLFGFLAFNGGSQASISQEGDAAAIAKSIVNTVIAGCSGGIVTLFLYRTGLFTTMNKWSFLMALNGTLTGMVSICSGCNVMKTWAACVTGTISAPIFLIVHISLQKLRIDDPLDAVGVHFGGGLWGLIAVALFQQDVGIVYGGSVEVLAWNMAGALAIIGWAGGLCLIVFGLLRLVGMLRVPADMEVQGLDILKHGEPAYPAEAWHESQYNGSSKTEDGYPRNLYLPPHMSNVSSPWYQNWSGFQGSGFQGSYPGPPMFWTLPDPRRPRNAHRSHHNLPPKMSEFYPNDSNPIYDVSPRARNGDMEDDRTHRPSRPRRGMGYTNDAFDDETSKL